MKRPLPATGSSASKTKRPSAQTISVEPLLPVPIPHTTARLARGIRAGRWLFATGQSGTDYKSGLAPEVVQAERPLNGESHSKRESRRLYQNVGEVLAEVGAGFPDVVRVDQYYTTVRAMHPYHEVRQGGVQRRDPGLDLQPAPALHAHRPDHRAAGHGGGAGRRPHRQARDLHAELQDFARVRLQPGAERRRLPFRARPDRGSARRTRPARSRSALGAHDVARMADQARDRISSSTASSRPRSKPPARASTSWSRRRSI